MEKDYEEKLEIIAKEFSIIAQCEEKTAYLFLKDFIENFGKSTLKCEFKNCNNDAEYEGWYRIQDFTGNTTGLVQKMSVCKDCSKHLIGYDKSNLLLQNEDKWID